MAKQPGSFAVIWGRRRVGKSRLLIEWSQRHGGLYVVADQSAPAVQRRYLAAAVARRFPGFDGVEYPDWRSFFERLGREARQTGWRGPFVLDELPYLIAADPGIVSVLQNWLDSPEITPSLVVSGSSQHMMHGAVLDADAPLYGRAIEAFAVRPLRAGYLQDAFGGFTPRELVSVYALWGGMPRYWELAAPFGRDLDGAVDALVLDPAGPLHDEAHRLLIEETPPAVALRPLLDVIGTGANRVSEIAGRIGRPASSLSRPLATLTAMDFVRRQTPFGSSPRSAKRSLYRLADPFLRFWFRVVAPHRAALAEAPRETRLGYWQRYRAGLEAYAWEELCRAAVPVLRRDSTRLARLGPWEPARRYWRGNDPEFDVVARSVDGRRVLVGEVKWGPQVQVQTTRTKVSSRLPKVVVDSIPGVVEQEVVRVLFVPERLEPKGTTTRHVVDAQAVLTALR